MKQRMINIVNYLVRTPNQLFVKSYDQGREDLFHLQTFYSDYGHATWLVFEPTSERGSIQVKITHVFGHFDASQHSDRADLLKLLRMNDGSFLTSNAYLAIKEDKRDGSLHACLQSYQCYLLAWRDEDIAKALFLQINDLMNGLMFEPPEPIRMYANQ